MNTVMNLQAKKLELVQLILNADAPSLLEKVENVLKKTETTDWWNDLSEIQKLELDESIAEADRGELLPHEEVMKEVRAKYKFL